MKKYYLLMIACVVALLSGCNIRDKKTTVEIVDPDRHYYSVLRGQVLDIVYEIVNTGENPLFISSIKTSCGCMLVDELSFKVLPVGGRGFIKLQYDSGKNIGYVKHYMTIYGNLDSDKPVEASFDLHVVPNALYVRDYEEIYRSKAGEKSLVDGYENELGYYLDDVVW